MSRQWTVFSEPHEHLPEADLAWGLQGEMVLREGDVEIIHFVVMKVLASAKCQK